ncbi:hypothetical protein pipiens_018607 [Culex pipiens pipiens]|uniref:Bombyxin B-1 homolog n=4 Tax=Culex pipiens TaxID=7175 RepID=A0A8D8K725_CULPI
MKLGLIVTIVLLMTHHAHARAVRRSCGKYLADRIYDICKARGGYSQLSAAPSTTTTTRAPELSHRRVRRGVVEECCRQSCTDATLIQYCMESAVESAENAQFGGGLDPNKSAMPSPTERSTNTIFSTKFPIRNTVPFEVGTVRPEFNNINAKYVVNRRKQYY